MPNVRSVSCHRPFFREAAPREKHRQLHFVRILESTFPSSHWSNLSSISLSSYAPSLPQPADRCPILLGSDSLATHLYGSSEDARAVRHARKVYHFAQGTESSILQNTLLKGLREYNGIEVDLHFRNTDDLRTARAAFFTRVCTHYHGHRSILPSSSSTA